jgi:S1-C subfamily serine protease
MKDVTMRKTLLVWLLFLLPLGAYAQTRDLPDFTELVEKQGPAVVNISTAQTMRAHPRVPQMPDLQEDDPFFEFFRRFMPQNPGQAPREFSTRSLGSGFIISADGYILTNAHVVAGADEITVRLTDKREFKAKVKGTDRRTDVALIKIDASGLPVVKLGDPNRLKVGEWVLAIGSPFGFDNTVTAGIVSGKARSLPQENLVPFIQTDAAVNPGNSGGPLFNLRGEVVGINSQIYSRTGGYMGLSFAIPIDLAMDVQNQLRSAGRVSRGRIGVVIQEVTKELADSFGLAKPQGALVNAVESDGPADKAQRQDQGSDGDSRRDPRGQGSCARRQSSQAGRGGGQPTGPGPGRFVRRPAQGTQNRARCAGRRGARPAARRSSQGRHHPGADTQRHQHRGEERDTIQQGFECHRQICHDYLARQARGEPELHYHQGLERPVKSRH